MGRKPNESEPTRWASLVLLLMGLVSCSIAYMFLSVALRPNYNPSISELESLEMVEDGGNGDLERQNGECCRGIENFELWGAAVKWGTDFKFNTSMECCKACKAMCTGNDGPCLCDTWVFCGNREACGAKFGELPFERWGTVRTADGNMVIWFSEKSVATVHKPFARCVNGTFRTVCCVQQGLVVYLRAGRFGKLKDKLGVT